MTRGRWFWLAVLLQVLLLFGMIGRHSYTLATGEPVLLKTAPVDPWDFFRGEYVRLNYEISRLDPDTTPMQGLPYKRGQAIWITLQKGNPYWTAAAVSDKRPAAGPGQLAVQGHVEWYQDEKFSQPEPRPMPPGEPTPPGQPTEPIPPPFPTGRLQIRYGIEQFYVPQGEGRPLEERRPDMTVEALVDSFGRIALHKVFIDGKEVTWR